MERYVAENFQSAWNEWRALLPSAFISPPWVRKCQSKRAEFFSYGQWWYCCYQHLRITMTMANLLVNQGHGSQVATISSIAAKDVHPWESPQCKLQERLLCYPWCWHRYKSIHLTFFSSCSTAFDTCKTALIYLNTKGTDFKHILRPYQFDFLIHEYGDSIFRKKDL